MSRFVLSDVLDEIEEYLEQRADVVDGPDSLPHPNDAMHLLARLRYVREQS